jgi:hypothetical protein
MNSQFSANLQYPQQVKNGRKGSYKKIKEVLNVPGKTLRSILDENFRDSQLDLLAIDAEGADFEVLQSLTFETLPRERFPKYLLLEAASSVANALRTPAVKLAIDHGYEPLMVLSMSTLLRRA